LSIYYFFIADGDCPNCKEGSFLAAGIAIGAAVVAALISVVCFCLYKKKIICEYYNINTDSRHNLFNIFHTKKKSIVYLWVQKLF